jgi:luciferase family oxidoreductase group 1
MLPNHAPLVVAEQFGTLESLYPGRIDLALGRAPGTDQATARALRRYFESADTFPNDVIELMSYFRAAQAGQRVTAIPGAGLNVPIYLLGSSDFSARLAAELGLPFGFASHFAPDYLQTALAIYRSEFQPSPHLEKPYVIVGAGVYAAANDDEAQHLFSSAQLQTLNLIRGQPTKLQPPNERIEELWSSAERAAIEHRTKYTAVGSAETVRAKFLAMLEETRADELIVTAQIFDHAARLRSFEMAADILQNIKAL